MPALAPRPVRRAVALPIAALLMVVAPVAVAAGEPVKVPVVATGAAVVGAAATPTGAGYWLAFADGRVLGYGDARSHGDVGGLRLHAPIAGITAARDGRGYWLVGRDGGVFAFGSARFGGSAAGLLWAPVVGIAATPTGRGYWIAAADGGVFSFGDARFAGSAAGRTRAAVTGIAATPTGRGYWLVDRAGAVHAFGDAAASIEAARVVRPPAAAIAASPSGRGHWVVGADGAVYAFGDVRYAGGIASDGHDRGVVAIMGTATGRGYWIVTARGAALAYGDAVWYGSVVRPRRAVPAQPVVLVYGDSLVTQSTPELAFQAGISGITIERRNFIGTAICDWLPDMTELFTGPADVAVLAFSGNAFTACVPANASDDEDVFLAHYRRSAQQAIAALAARGIPVVFALPPPRERPPAAMQLPALYRSVVAASPGAARVYDAGASVAGPGRVWTETLPCLGFETAAWGCRAGRIAVRSPDRLHFCTGDLRVPGDLWSGCDRWSSGAWRYAAALLEAARAGLR